MSVSFTAPTSRSEEKPNQSQNSKKESLSKTLSYILRHAAAELGIKVYPEGYVNVEDILEREYFKKRGISLEEIEKCVDKQKQKQFTMKTDPDTGKLQIRAEGLHTFELKDMNLDRVTSPQNHPTVIHVEKMSNWQKIKKLGLSMKTLVGGNQKIGMHFVIAEPESEGGEELTIDGKQDAGIWIYLDLDKAMKGIKFYYLDDVIVTSGNKQGYIESKFFSKVLNLRTGQEFGQPKK